MRQYALEDPEGQVQAMSTSWDALEDLIQGMDEDDACGWVVRICDMRFWNEHPEISEFA